MTPTPDESLLTVRTDVTGQGQPLVIVPGGLTGWNSWQVHAERLARDRRVIRTQLLSVQLGLTGEPLPPDYSLETESHALTRALNDLDVEWADVVGWSYGGAIALDFALDHPERVRSLTLIEPAAFWVLRGLGRFGPDAQAYQRKMRTFDLEEITEDQLVNFLSEAGMVPAGTDVRSLPEWPLWAEHRNSLRIADVETRHEDAVERLGHFDRPVLLFKGAGSTGYEREIVDLLGRELPDSRVVELPGGHALPFVSMERFLAILGDFLDEHAAT